MTTTQVQLTESILEELKGLPSRKLKEILDFVSFIKAKEFIDPSQLYFFTKKWQAMEKEADADIAALRVSRSYGAHELDAFFADLKKHKREKENQLCQR